MNLRTLTWNIGGGKLLRSGEDPELMASYTVHGIDAIANRVRESNADVITIQEAHGNDGDNQIAQIARVLGYEHYFYDATSDSHIDPAYKLGNGLISRFPITGVQTGRFHNPQLTFEIEGRTAFTHDKGYGSCMIHMGNIVIYATSLHLIPFRSVGLEFDSEEAQQILTSVSTELKSREEVAYRLIQGDFNINSETVRAYFEDLFASENLNEISLDMPTTPKDRKYDHVLFNGLKLGQVSVDSAVDTDHYPVICDFEA